MERNGLRAVSEGNEFDRLSLREDMVAALVEVVGDGEDDMVVFVSVRRIVAHSLLPVETVVNI